MARLATRFKGKWVQMRMTAEDGYVLCLILGTAMEGGNPCYVVRYENGLEDLVFMSSVDRICIAPMQTQAKILTLVKKKNKKPVVQN